MDGDGRLSSKVYVLVLVMLVFQGLIFLVRSSEVCIVCPARTRTRTRTRTEKFLVHVAIQAVSSARPVAELVDRPPYLLTARWLRCVIPPLAAPVGSATWLRFPSFVRRRGDDHPPHRPGFRGPALGLFRFFARANRKKQGMDGKEGCSWLFMAVQEFHSLDVPGRAFLRK